MLAVHEGVMGRWNRNIGHERPVTEPHDDSVQPPVLGFSGDIGAILGYGHQGSAPCTP